MKAKKNENGKIDLYLSNNYTNVMKVGEFDSVSTLERVARELLSCGEKCAGGMTAREYSYMDSKGNMVFKWLR